jgi:type I restriction-modification system DNA methylase subunit
MNQKKTLGQYFTPLDIARTLVDKLKHPVKNVLELGAGNGQLGLAFSKKFPHAKYLGIEVDPASIQACKESLPGYQVECFDVLSQVGFETIKTIPTVDAIVGNPPFIQTDPITESKELLTSIFPSFNFGNKKVRAELIFLAYSIFKLKRGGQASFILPTTFFTSDLYEQFRKELVRQFSDISVLELPHKIFSGAEVSTCIFSFKHEKSHQRKVTLGRLNEQGKLIDSLNIAKKSAVTRMDYSFHRLLQNLDISDKQFDQTLESIGGSVKRGNASRAAIKSENIRYFHTTSFPKQQRHVFLDDGCVGDFRYAQSGDILTSRVGSRCLDRQVLVASGQRAITDCVYQIKVDNDYVDRVMNTLSSRFGVAWRQIHAKGSCAKYITNSSLLTMPLL